MDASTFDRLSRLLGDGSRRIALRTILGGTLVAAAGTLASATGGDAKKKKKRKKCPDCPTCPVCPTCVGKALGTSCFTARECCGNETNRSCARATGGGAPVCCGTGGSPCSVDGDCCNPFECFNNQCLLLF